MSLVLISPPTQDVVTLAEAKEHLRVDANDDDTLIGRLIGQVVASLDPASGGTLGRALRPQTWELRLAEFPLCPIRLPFPPAIEIESIKYDAADGAEQTVAGSDYRLIGQGAFQPVRLSLSYGASWPAARYSEEAVRIRFVAGYDADDEGGDRLPTAIKVAALLMIGDLYENRETVAVGAVSSKIEMSAPVEQLLLPHRILF